MSLLCMPHSLCVGHKHCCAGNCLLSFTFVFFTLTLSLTVSSVPSHTSRKISRDRLSHTACQRSVYERAFRSLRESQPDAKEEALMLLEAWRAFEAAAGSGETAVAAVERRMPKRVKRKRPVTDDFEVGVNPTLPCQSCRAVCSCVSSVVGAQAGLT